MQEALAKPYHKPSDLHGSYLRRFYRAMGGKVALLLQNTPVTPNHVTLASFFLGLLALPFVVWGVFPFHLIAAGLLFLSMILDEADGSLARLKGTSSALGTWLDSTTDYLGIFLFFLMVGAHFHYVQDKPIYWFFVFLGFGGYNISKLMYIYFKRYFGKDADAVVEEEKEKHPLRSSLHVNEIFVNNIFFLFLLIGRLDWLLWFMAGYGLLFSAGIYGVLTYKAVRKNRTHSPEEGMYSKF